MRRIALVVAALVPLLAAGPAVGQSPASPPIDDESAERLSDCQSDELSSADRHAHCTWVIEKEALPDTIRAEAFLNRAIVHLNEGSADRALPDLDKAIALNPTYPAPYAYRAEAHDAKGSHDKALADYDKAISLDPGNADLLADRGLVHAKKGDKTKAKADFDAAIGIVKDHPVATEGLKGLGGQ